MTPRLLVRGMMGYYGARFWRPLAAAAERPAEAQREALLRILRANRDTTFGREHGFAGVRSHDDYCRSVPVREYEGLRPYVERQRTTGEAALTREAPAFYAQTSGSTGAPKYIPITPAVLKQTRAEQKVFSYLQHRACPEAFAGKTLGIMGAAVEETLDSGHAVGSVSGHLYGSMPRCVQRRFVVPPEVSTIVDYDLKYRLILRLALEVADITYLGAPNPSSFLRLAELLERDRANLTASLAGGHFDGEERLAPDVRRALAGRITAQPGRAAALDRLPSLTFASVWPDIRLLTTWTGGSCGIALGALRALLPPAVRVMELGYQATEFRGTLALDTETSGGLPPLHHHFFEFVETGAWDAGRPEFLMLHELQPGQRYQVIVTTAAGLYRYFMNDLVEVTGTYQGTPLLRFVQKGRGVTSITGEKLYEAQAIDAVTHAARTHGFEAGFFLVAADEQAAGYTLYLEAGRGALPPASSLAAAVDAQLGARNLEYHAKRASGRLAPLRVVWLRHGAGEAYKAACVQKGQREGQYKPAVLQYVRELKLPPAALHALQGPEHAA